MKTSLLAALFAGLLTVAGAAAVVSTKVLPAPAAQDAAGADMAAMHHGMAGDAHDAQLGMDRLAFPQAIGSTPTAEDAKSLEQVSGITIRSDKDFTPAAGIRSGSGTLADPYIISGYDVTGILYLADTDACFTITGNYIDGELALNWNGNCVHVHHNFIRDLRVNENVQREGYDTGGLIELNQINYVGQIRHYDGEFRNNVVGPREDAKLPFGVFQDPENLLPFTKDTRVLNIDGFNEGYFHHNTITGSVDLKLHGHHHSTGFLATHSHYHGDNATKMAAMSHDHTNRWESVRFEDNKVIDPTGYGLRYTDEAHAGDDRTASSETTKSLSDDHQHHTKVQLQQRHDGLLGTQLFGQRFDANTGIAIDTVKEMQMDVRGNTLSWQATQSSDPLEGLLGGFLAAPPTPVGIRVNGVRDGNLTLVGNQGTGFVQGIAGFNMDERAQWDLFGNSFPGAGHEVYYDSSVENKPTTLPAEPLADPGAWGPGAEPMDDMAGMDMHHHGA
jgi:hypothetical protein